MLKYIFLDESGDLGFTPKSSKYFIVACLCVDEEKIVKRCIKTVRKGLSKKYKKTELKFSNSSKTTKRRVLECIALKNISISYLALNKGWIHSHLRNKNFVIHNYMIAQLLSELLDEASNNKTIIVIDKFLPYKNIVDFNRYIGLKTPSVLDIRHESSHGSNGIQAVDFIAGAIHLKYRTNDESFYSIISNKVNVSLDTRENIFKKR